ncbi:MAG: hypothetical protein ABI624_03480 [Casimicrobiaceae bacterium]
MGPWNHWRGEVSGLWLRTWGRLLNDPLLTLRGEFDLLHSRWESRGIMSGRHRRPALLKAM